MEPEEELARRVAQFKVGQSILFHILRWVLTTINQVWLSQQEASRIAVVSHSTFLRDLQGLSEKMPNCHIQEMLL